MTDEQITAYLLKELTDEEAERFEEECFDQEKWPDEIDTVEQELIDAYLRNELTRDRRTRFEEKYMTTDARKARVLTAQSFLQVLCPPQKKTWKEKIEALWQRPLVPQTAIAVLVLAVVAAVIVPRIIRPNTFERLDLALVSSDRADGLQMERVKLPLNADALKIHLKVPEPASPNTAYRVEWENAKESLGELPIEERDSQSIVVIVPGNKLSPDRYTLKLFKTNGSEPEQRVPGAYFFTAEEAAPTR